MSYLVERVPGFFLDCLYYSFGIRRQENIFIETSPFASQDWKEFFHLDVQSVPIPKDLCSFLEQPCPFWPTKLVKETHFLFFVPANLDQHSFIELVQPHLSIQPYGIDNPSPLNGPYWGLLTKRPIPNSTFDFFKTQKALLGQNQGYEVPKITEVMIAMSAGLLKERIYLFQGAGGKTHCEEFPEGKENLNWPFTIGCWVSGDKLEFNIMEHDREGNGLAAIRRFSVNE